MNFTLHLVGHEIETEADFHEAVRAQSGIEWYGANLDAFWDMLVNIIPCSFGEFRVRWDDYDKSMKTQHQRKLMILGILKEAEQHAPDRLKEVSLTFSEPVYAEWDDPFTQARKNLGL